MNLGPKMTVFGGLWCFFLGRFLGGLIYSIRSTRVEFPKLWRAFFTQYMLIKPVKYMNLGPKSAIFGGFRWFFGGRLPNGPRYSIGSTRVVFPKLLLAFLTLNML